MAMPSYASVAEYLEAQPPAVRKVLVQVRAAIRKALPRAEESVSYTIPTYKIGGKPVVYFAAWKKHYSIYPITSAVQHELRAELSGVEVEKGTVRFGFDVKVPGAMIGRIAKLRAAELTPEGTKPAKGSTKKAATKTSTHPVRLLAMQDQALVERLRKLCLALPEANERVSHGEPTWFAGKGKVFAMLDNHHHGAEHLAVWLPMPRGVQEARIAADARRFFKPPYVGPSGWVGVVLDTKPDWKLVTQLVREAYTFVATAKLRAKL